MALFILIRNLIFGKSKILLHKHVSASSYQCTMKRPNMQMVLGTLRVNLNWKRRIYVKIP